MEEISRRIEEVIDYFYSSDGSSLELRNYIRNKFVNDSVFNREETGDYISDKYVIDGGNGITIHLTDGQVIEDHERVIEGTSAYISSPFSHGEDLIFYYDDDIWSVGSKQEKYMMWENLMKVDLSIENVIRVIKSDSKNAILYTGLNLELKENKEVQRAVCESILKFAEEINNEQKFVIYLTELKKFPPQENEQLLNFARGFISKNLNEIKNDIYSILEYSQNSFVTSKDIKNEIFEVFKNTLWTTIDETNQAYYQQKSTNCMINGGNGITITIEEGPGDTNGRHDRSADYTSIAIQSPFSMADDLYFWVHGESNNDLSIQQMYDEIDKLLDVDMSKENIVEALRQRPHNVLKLCNALDVKMKNDPDILKSTFDNLLVCANVVHKNQRDYSDISPYGGLDVTVQKPLDIMIEELNKITRNENQEFWDYGIEYISKLPNINDFLDKEIDICNRELYYLENKEAYDEVWELDMDYMYKELGSNIMPLEKIEATRKSLKEEAANYLVEMNRTIKKLENEIIQVKENSQKPLERTFRKRYNENWINALKLQVESVIENGINYNNDISFKDMECVEAAKYYIEKEKAYEPYKGLKYKYQDYSKDGYEEGYDYYEQNDKWGYKGSIDRLQERKPEIQARFELLNEINLEVRKSEFKEEIILQHVEEKNEELETLESTEDMEQGKSR